MRVQTRRIRDDVPVCLLFCTAQVVFGDRILSNVFVFGIDQFFDKFPLSNLNNHLERMEYWLPVR